jgi:hypothetical protein
MYDKSLSPEFSETYGFFAPLVVLSYPSGVVLPRLRPDPAPRSGRKTS